MQVFFILLKFFDCLGCSTLDNSCIECLDLTTCIKCSGNLLIYGSKCLEHCILGTYPNNGSCIGMILMNRFIIKKIDCLNIEPFCSECSNSTCSACTGGKFFNGTNCDDACPLGTYGEAGICKGKKNHKIHQ